MNLLDNIPLATVLALVAYGTAVYLIVTGKIVLDTPTDFLTFFGGLGAATYGAGKLGEARNGADRGIRR